MPFEMSLEKILKQNPWWGRPRPLLLLPFYTYLSLHLTPWLFSHTLWSVSFLLQTTKHQVLPWKEAEESPEEIKETIQVKYRCSNTVKLRVIVTVSKKSPLFIIYFLVLPVYCYQPISLHPRAHMLSHVIPWTSARLTPLSMDFSRQEYWSEKEPFKRV